MHSRQGSPIEVSHSSVIQSMADWFLAAVMVPAVMVPAELVQSAELAGMRTWDGEKLAFDRMPSIPTRVWSQAWE